MKKLKGQRNDPTEKGPPKFDALVIGAAESRGNAANKDWWENNPMLYDWERSLGDPALSPEYFTAIDDIFGEGHSLVNNPRWPQGYILEKFIPYEKFAGKDVLEIGCGAGLVASHIARAGARLTAIDITDQAVGRTRRRFEQAGLQGNIARMDAERMRFPDASFDFVVSWGVIHHSGNMQAILDEIYRVLRPGGQACIMVYNKNSLRYQVYCRFWLGVMRGRLLKESVAQINGSITDGYIARHLTAPEFRAMASRFRQAEFSCSDEKLTILKYLFGVGSPFRPIPRITRRFEQWLARRWGWYLQVVLTK